MLTQVHGKPGAVEIFLAIHKVREILRLVEQKTVLCLPAREVLKCLKGSDIDILVTGVERTVDA